MLHPRFYTLGVAALCVACVPAIPDDGRGSHDSHASVSSSATLDYGNVFLTDSNGEPFCARVGLVRASGNVDFVYTGEDGTLILPDDTRSVELYDPDDGVYVGQFDPSLYSFGEEVVVGDALYRRAHVEGFCTGEGQGETVVRIDDVRLPQRATCKLADESGSNSALERLGLFKSQEPTVAASSALAHLGLNVCSYSEDDGYHFVETSMYSIDPDIPTDPYEPVLVAVYNRTPEVLLTVSVESSGQEFRVKDFALISMPQGDCLKIVARLPWQRDTDPPLAAGGECNFPHTR